MKNKQYAVLAVCAAAAGAFLLFNPPAQSEAGHRHANKLEGAWIAKAPVPGMPVQLQWTYTLSPDPSGRRAALSGSIQVHIPPAIVPPVGRFADLEYNSPFVGELVMTGHDTADFTAVWYGMKKAFPFNQIVYIGVNSGQVTFTGPGQSEVTHALAFYAPSTDGDNDGLPDPGEGPRFACHP
ncbi:MAG: hypothetical protein HYY24_02910 [Verrucomicrobia bacterium]|nr:hypothetical protein [Verrucomicrobiota bacterium]